MTEQPKEQVLEIDADQLQGLMSESDILPPIEIPMEWYDTVEFHKGIHEASYLAGKITALLNAGVSESFVLDYLLNQATIEHNLETARINKEMNVEVSKNAKVTQDKYEL
jgi:hypothetical protein